MNNTWIWSVLWPVSLIFNWWNLEPRTLRWTKRWRYTWECDTEWEAQTGKHNFIIHWLDVWVKLIKYVECVCVSLHVHARVHVCVCVGLCVLRPAESTPVHPEGWHGTDGREGRESKLPSGISHTHYSDCELADNKWLSPWCLHRRKFSLTLCSGRQMAEQLDTSEEDIERESKDEQWELLSAPTRWTIIITVVIISIINLAWWTFTLSWDLLGCWEVWCFA